MRAQIASATDRAFGWREQLLDLLFPVRCVSCRRAGESLCSDCRSRIQFVTPPFCSRCGAPEPRSRTTCLRCRANPLALTLIRSVGFHEGVLREAVHAHKYNNRRDLTAPLAALLAELFCSLKLHPDIITSVPLHPRRERERGYNQSELLGREFAKNVSLPYIDGLRRTRETADQVNLNGTRRRENVRGAFTADAAAFLDKRVVLVDDVCTTGSTLDECGIALLERGAREVYGLTVSRPR